VLPEAVARALRGVLVGVVERGTAGRLAGTYRDAEGKPLPVGGKTGSGDNRYKTFSRDGELLTGKVVNRTATFVFFIGDRFWGADGVRPRPGSRSSTFTSNFCRCDPRAARASRLRLLEPEPTAAARGGSAPGRAEPGTRGAFARRADARRVRTHNPVTDLP
jgi:hypothetical protein